MRFANCSRCGLTLPLENGSEPPERCPRCLARTRRIVTMTVIEPGTLELSEHSRCGAHHLVLTGEMDITTASVLEARVVELCSRGASSIVLDITGLSFIDSRGMTAVLMCRKRCESRGCRFSVTRGQERVQRLFDVFATTRAGADEGSLEPVGGATA